MARTKQAARRNNTKKRPYDSQEEDRTHGPHPRKKAKASSPSSLTLGASDTATALPQLPPHTSVTASSTSKPPAPASTNSQSYKNTLQSPSSIQTQLQGTHDLTTSSIISSSQIRQKVTRVLDVLSVYPPPANGKPKVVMLHAKAPCASKMISIAEIAKRELAKEGAKWFEYCTVEGVMVEVKKPEIVKEKNIEGERKKGQANKGPESDTRDGKEEVGQDDAESGEETTAFENMKTPFERAIEGKAKIRAVPVMSIYLSRIRIEGLRSAYGEQTNALPPQKKREQADEP